MRDQFSDQGIWRESDLRESSPAWGQRFALSGQRFVSLLVARLGLIVAAALAPQASLFLALFATQLLITMRFRGPVNGGSDYVTTLALALVWIEHSFPNSKPIQEACLLYLGIQIALSYFISGLSKVFASEWRSGRALSIFLNSSKYQVPAAWLKRAQNQSAMLRLGSFAVLSFELSFPVALLHPNLCLLWMSAGVFFHWMNFRIFGLNRFFWIWLACYPALFETSKWIAAQL